jgi:hypothetical protein
VIPVVCVPAKKLIVSSTEEVEIYRAHMNIPLCENHGHEIHVKHFLSDKLTAQFFAAAKAQKKLPPDIERAYVMTESMAGDSYQRILQSEKTQGHNGFRVL